MASGKTIDHGKAQDADKTGKTDHREDLSKKKDKNSAKILAGVSQESPEINKAKEFPEYQRLKGKAQTKASTSKLRKKAELLK